MTDAAERNETASPSLHAVAGILVVFLLLGFNQLSSFSFSDGEVAALEAARGPLREIHASAAVDRSPAFLHLLRALMSLGLSGELPIRAAFVLLGCGAVAWLWEGARKTLPAEFALVAAFLCALSPGWLGAVRQVGPWAPGLFCAAAALACLAHALRNVAALSTGEELAAERRVSLVRRMAAWWAGFAVAAAGAASLHPYGGLLALGGVALAAPSCGDRRALAGLGAGLLLVGATLWASSTWTAAAYPAVFQTLADDAPVPRSAAGLPVTGALAAFVALVRGESGAVPEALVVPAGLAYFVALALGLYRLWEAGDRGVRIVLSLLAVALAAGVFAPGTHLRSAVFLLPAFVLATATGLMFLHARVRAVALAFLLACHLFAAQGLARGDRLLDPSLAEPHREVARALASALRPSDALLTAGELAPFWFAFRERPVRYALELRPEGAVILGRKDGRPESFLDSMRYERRRFWLLVRLPAEPARAREFHARLGVLVDWLATTTRILERRTFDSEIALPADAGSPGLERVERIRLFLIDPLSR